MGLVLRWSGLDHQQPLPAEFVEAVQQVVAGDARLVAHLQQLDLCGSTAAGVVPWDKVASQLPRWLVHALPTVAEADGLGQHLTAVCHLALRQQALASHFQRSLMHHKREALYHLAYGLSHELNNPLANIASRAGLLASQASHPHHAQLLETIVNHAMRGSEMLGDLMLVARPPQLRRHAVRLDQLLARVCDRASSWTAGWPIIIQRELPSPLVAQLDEPAFSEAMWALIRNAIEAMPEGGQVSVQLSEISPDQPVADAPPEQSAELSSGRQLRIAVADQGVGLSPQALVHCFDPYYSGREAGRGLGLGLTKALRIVELHDGRLSLRNRSGAGCVAEIILPAGSLPAAVSDRTAALQSTPTGPAM